MEPSVQAVAESNGPDHIYYSSGGCFNLLFRIKSKKTINKKPKFKDFPLIFFLSKSRCTGISEFLRTEIYLLLKRSDIFCNYKVPCM
jgi:hypothetical protein